MSYEFAMIMFAALLIGLASGHPLAFVLGGLGVIFGVYGWGPDCLTIFVNSIFGVMNNYTLVAIPLFVLMANFLTSSNVTEGLFDSVRYLLGKLKGGMGLTVIMVSTVFAACTGVVGASVITMGLLSIGALSNYGYDRRLTAGLICAGGSLGILIPPSIMLVVLASTANLSVGKLFMAAMTPGLLLASCYAAYTLIICHLKPNWGPAISDEELARVPMKQRIAGSLINLVPPMILILFVLGSIYTGWATPTEASGVGAFIALIMTVCYRRFSLKMLQSAVYDAAKTTGMCLAIMVGASAFTSMFLGLGGDEAVNNLISSMGLGQWGVFALLMLITFILGCFLDWIGIVMIVLPIFLPLIRMTDFDMLWLMAVLATMLQTCFLTPPFGYALFYLKGIAPKEMSTMDIYAGVIPFVLIIITVVILLTVFPELVLWLPNRTNI
ncbi:TRAP transporter large permease subunit [Deltaproteobacteria bacterium OttesenSCG-928-K17]|nr:TRAP transporter large permease subunit [Deltaproteobacteria bacterium OttesenSCG-928-K17]